ncbi:MAG: cyanate transporter [Comamonas sp.]|jgi:CP family cyanate transporter-like MFS transporter|uniref:cyanate transporter n=1 Tax=Comamonas sp. TaxID=34028 RepID=UPI0025E33D6F|nr:cyanate transporter [Comamonas sp.]MDR3066880.1 cyanate transporter [Comamonas sp.]
MTSTSSTTHRVPPLLWLLVVALVTLNLRPFLTAPGPLAPAIQQATGMDLRSFSWLTLLPMALMGIGGWLAPAALQRWGARASIGASLLMIALGCALRLTPAGDATVSLLIATAGLCGAGVALAQSILPGLIKRQSPHHVAPMMGLYSATLMGGGALGAQLSPMLMQQGSSWQASLAIWAIPALLALPLAWHALTLMREPAASVASGRMAPSHADTGWLLRRGRTWLLLISFGLMNGGYGSTVAWLAPFYQAHGWTATQSGSLLAVLSIAQAASALVMPALARRSLDRRSWVMLALLLQIIGFAGLGLWPDAMPSFNAIVLGLGLGGCFSLFMLVALDHLPSSTQAGALNSLMQGGGFILAALAPLVMAQLHQSSGHWTTGWLYQAGVAALVCLLATRFNPQGYPQAMQQP